VTNIVAEANESITTYLDQSGSKPSAGAKKRAPRRSDATKIESVFVRVDVFAEVHSLLLSTMSYLYCMAEEGKNKRIVQPAIASLTYAAAQLKEHLGGLSSDLNHTASLKQAQQSHSKKTKRARREAADQAIQMKRLMKDKPSQALHTSLSIAKTNVAAIVSKADDILPAQRKVSDDVLPPRKRAKTNDETEEEIIRLPRPTDGKLMYSPQEAINILYSLCVAPEPKPARMFVKRIKQKMIDDRLVPIGRRRLNELLRDHGGPGKPMANLHWNDGGRPIAVEYEVLLGAYKERTRMCKGWSLKDTKAFLLKAKTDRLARMNLDTSNVEPPCQKTVLSYNSALMSDAALTMRKCDTKTVYREAAETSQRSMLTDACGILAALSYIAPTKTGIPLEYRFDEKRATPGALLSRRIVAEAVGVPPQSIEFVPRSLITNQDDMAVMYDAFIGKSAEEGKESMLVEKSQIANNSSYGVHGNTDTNKQFDGIKMRLTNMLGAGGHLAPTFAQILNFSDAEIPPSLVPNGIIQIRLRGLSTDGGLNPHSTAYGFVVLVRKGTGIETQMFRDFNADVAEPFIDQLRSTVGCEDSNNVPKWGKAMLSSDGGVPQMKAIQDIEYLRRKRGRQEAQLKLSKQRSSVVQPCDTGRGHQRTRHWSKKLTKNDLPHSNLVRPLTETLHCLRDEGKLITSAKKMHHIVNAVSRLPTVLRKSYSESSIIESFLGPGFLDTSLQAPDMNRLFLTYKERPTVEQRKKWEVDCVEITRTMISGGRVLEDDFQSMGYPIDTDSGGGEHPLSEAFASQHHRQRCTIMTNPTLIGDFEQAKMALQMRDASTMAEENARLSSVDDERWRDQILEDNTAYEGELHKLHGRTSGDRCRDDFLDDETRSQRVLKHVAQKRGQCKPFVQARKMQRKGDSSFKEPKCVGKLKGLQSALQKLDNGGSEDQLTKQENSWILQTILCYKLPLKLVVDEGTNEGSAGDGGDDERGTDEGGADEEGVVDPPPARPRTLVVDASTFLELRRNEFLNNAETVGDLSHAIKGCRIETRIHATLKVHAEALTRLLPEQLARMATTLPDQVRYSWVMAACRDNIDSMAQIISLAGQSMMNVETSTYGECILRPPSIGYYSKPLQSDDLKSFQGVALYYDHQKAKFRFPAIVHGSGKSFEQRWKEDQRNAKSKTPSTSFAKQYPSSKPRDAEKGGWDGVFGRDLTMYVGIGIDPNGNNECLLRKENGPFVWSERTMKKLEESSATGTIADKQLRLICAMFELTYFLMMGKDDAIDIGTPFRHFIGPSK